jgi:hypothetical protein
VCSRTAAVSGPHDRQIVRHRPLADQRLPGLLSAVMRKRSLKEIFLESEIVYVITRGQWIIGDSRLFIGKNPEGRSVVDLCRQADRFDGHRVDMITYTPVDTDGPEVYAVYQTRGIPIKTKRLDHAAVDLAKANGTLVGYVQRVMALSD